MRLNELELTNFKGYEHARFNFGDFQALTGPNGHGKTTVLEAISLICSSLDFSDGTDAVAPELVDDKVGTDWKPTVSGAQRLAAYLRRNIRSGEKSFTILGKFEHEGLELIVELNEKGFVRNDLLKSEIWWPGICYFAKFDSEMTSFMLPWRMWSEFKPAYEAITGFEIEPEILEEDEIMLTDDEEDDEEARQIVVGFWLEKPASFGRPASRIYCRDCSAGEKKIAKTLSNIVNLEESRQPYLVLVDNIELHIHYKRHLTAVDEIKKIFAGKQIVATTHSTTIMASYEPKTDIIDLEVLLQNG